MPTRLSARRCCTVVCDLRSRADCARFGCLTRPACEPHASGLSSRLPAAARPPCSAMWPSTPAVEMQVDPGDLDRDAPGLGLDRFQRHPGLAEPGQAGHPRCVLAARLSEDP